MIKHVAAALVATVCLVQGVHGQDLGNFVGRVVVEWITEEGPDRGMRLIEDFGFVDPAGKEWKVPAGAVVDGASIPRVLWTAAGSPFTGDYRRASVVHDRYCDTKTEPWQAVHRMFYEAMLAGGVKERQAKAFYAAVRLGGPQWELKRVEEPDGDVVEIMTTSTKELSEAQLEELERWVEVSNPTLDAIDTRVDAERHRPQ